MKVIISNEMNNKIEALQYEVESRKDILAYMISSGMSNTEAFDKYHKEYQNWFVEFNKAKMEMLQENEIPASVEWYLDFATHELVYNEKGNECSCGK